MSRFVGLLLLTSLLAFARPIQVQAGWWPDWKGPEEILNPYPPNDRAFYKFAIENYLRQIIDSKTRVELISREFATHVSVQHSPLGERDLRFSYFEDSRIAIGFMMAHYKFISIRSEWLLKKGRLSDTEREYFESFKATALKAHSMLKVLVGDLYRERQRLNPAPIESRGLLRDLNNEPIATWIPQYPKGFNIYEELNRQLIDCLGLLQNLPANPAAADPKITP